MDLRRTLRSALPLGALGAAIAASPAPARPESAGPAPDILVIFADDLGYADLGCTGEPDIRTPCIDRMAAEGRRLTSFYVAASVCTPSRVALLTGCYPKRVDMHVGVLFPEDARGLHPDEETIAEVLGGAGYATGLVGKWHVGHSPPLLPTRQGFDTFFGCPYSHDMGASRWIPLAADARLREGRTRDDYLESRVGGALMRGTEIVEFPVGPDEFTGRFTREALEIVRARAGAPYFLYLPHVMPHIPLGASREFRGRSPIGPYGDAVEELDRSTGRLLDAIREGDRAERSIVVFTSDNGPLWAEARPRPSRTGSGRALPGRALAGSSGPLRGWKGTTWEGGVRVPCIVWAPGRIPAGSVSDALVTTMDLLPTFAGRAGAPLPSRPIDGRDVWPLLTGEVEEDSPPPLLYYARNGVLEGIRRGDWKLLVHDPKVLERCFPRRQRQLAAEVPRVELFQLAEDVGETINRADERPDLVADLLATMARLDAEIAARQRPAWHPEP